MLTLLRARQFEAEVVCPGGGALERELQELGIPVHPLEFGKYSVRQNPFWHLGFFLRFRRMLKACHPDVVVINLDGNTPLVTAAAVSAGIRIIRFCRFEFTPPTRWLDRWCWLKVRGVICPSDLVKQQVLAWAPPGFCSRVHRFYESFAGREASAAEIAACRAEFKLDGDKVIGFVGRLHRGKRIETAIRALAEVRKTVSDVRLLILGDHDGSPGGLAYRGDLQRLATDLDLADCVVFAGYRPAERLPAAVAACCVCVLPSESESFGMALMEAWAQGVPTVASDVSGCREITQASGAGVLAPVGDAAVFSSRLTDLLTDQEAAVAMGEKGRVWVAQNCSPTRYAANFKLLLNAPVSRN